MKVLCWRNTDDKTKTNDIVSIRQLLSFAKHRSTQVCVFISFVCAVIAGLVYPALAFYFTTAFGNLSRSTSSSSFSSSILRTVYAFLALGAIMGVAMFLQAALMESAAAEIARELKQQWFQALLRQDMAYFDIKNVAGEATTVSTNGTKVQKGIGHKLAEAVQFTVACIGSYAFALYSSWQVGLTILSVAPFLVFATRFLVKMTTTQTKRANENYAYAGAIVSTTVSSMRTILSLNAVDKQIGLYRDATDYAAHQATQLSLWRGLATGLQMVTSLMAYIVLTGYGAYLLYRQVRSDGCDPSGTVEGVASCRPSGSNVFGALLGVQIGSNMLSQCAIAIEALTEAQVAAVPALKVLQRRVHENDVDEADYDDADKGYKKKDIESGGNGTTDGSSTSEHDGNSAGALTTSAAPILPKYVIDSSSHNGTKLKQVAGNIEFRNVSFSYPARPETQVVKSVSLMVPAGKTVAICGPSGSGKSTIVQLVERFYDPSAGSVLLDGNDLRTLNVKWLREQIGLVLQEPKLFGKSIGENIALGAPGASREDVEEAARLANAHDFIMTFPDGYDTMVGDLGGQLSGGQRQRIALARVLVKKPKILLLDEATSALDSESERIVQQALENLLEQSTFTTIVVAHRLSTIRNADLIAVMAQGVLHETGTHDELLAKKGLYYDLVQAQKTAPAAPAPPPPVPAAIESTPNADSQTADETSEEIAAANRRESTLDSSVFRVVHPGEQPLIEFRNIRFRYPARPDIDVFRDLNLSVYKGETLALVGPSGCGKSTVVQLIEAFYRPLDGAVLYCGVDTRELNTRWLRDEMGLVSQEAMLFATTIEENIRYGCPGATMEEIIAAAKQANCHNFITQFPDGYQTRIGEGSNLVSGGQKQRIAIARALVKKPKVLLLDEATSALDSESEKIVQAALDNLMADKGQTCVVIAHRLSTIRNADRIAVIDNGKVREIGSHDELMAKPNGKYRQLIQLQNLDDAEHHVQESESIEDDAPEETVDKKKSKETKEEKEDLSRDETKRLKKRAMMMGWQDKWYILVGIIGAIVAGIMYPSWGFMFAYMINLVYTHVGPCDPERFGLSGCQKYWGNIADHMHHTSILMLIVYAALSVAAVFGNMAVYWGFGSATERMNKRVRDAAFTNLVRQEIAWFDTQSPGAITSQLEDDAALLHAFTGAPIRVYALAFSSVLVGLGVAFYFMWPFALLVCLLLPFLAFSAKMKRQRQFGEDDISNDLADSNSPGNILIETLSNMRTVASLTLEQARSKEYHLALLRTHPNSAISNVIKGAMIGLGQFIQMWSFGLMFWWGGWLLSHYPTSFTYRGYLISMWSLFLSMNGLAIAAESAVDADEAKEAAHRVFTLTDRKSAIDPLSTEGRKDVRLNMKLV